jgi:hypothetical protein
VASNEGKVMPNHGKREHFVYFEFSDGTIVGTRLNLGGVPFHMPYFTNQQVSENWERDDILQ